MRIDEIIKLEVGGATVEVKHEGIKAFKDWTWQSKKDLLDIVTEEIEKGKTEFWMPFANFEASVQFNLNAKK